MKKTKVCAFMFHTGTSLDHSSKTNQRRSETSLTTGCPCRCEGHQLLFPSCHSCASVQWTRRLCPRPPQLYGQQEHKLKMGAEDKHGVQGPLVISDLLLTNVTAQHSPCRTSGRPPGGTTTPGSMRSVEHQEFSEEFSPR